MFISILLIALFYLFQKRFPLFKKETFYLLVLLISLSLFAGKTLRFYYLIPHWDKILHFLSGIILYLAGDDIYFKAGGNKNRLLRGIFALLFSVSAAALWEIWEFSGDTIFHTNAQNGSLKDTMYDIIAGISGGALRAFYFFLFSR